MTLKPINGPYQSRHRLNDRVWFTWHLDSGIEIHFGEETRTLLIEDARDLIVNLATQIDTATYMDGAPNGYVNLVQRIETP